MNILFTYITPFHPQRGGIGRVTDSLTREFIRRGHQVFYMIYPSLLYPFGVKDTESYDFPAPPIMTPSMNLMSDENVLFYLHFLRDKHIDLVINQSGTNADSFLWAKSCEIGIPIVSCIHQFPLQSYEYMWESSVWPLRNDTLIEKAKRIARMMLYYRTRKRYFQSEYNHYSNILPKTTKLCLLSEKYFSKVDMLHLDIDYSSKLCAIPNPNSYSAIEDINVTQKKKQLLYVGLFNNAKGPQRLVSIWKRLYKKHEDWEMVIVGSGQEGLVKRVKRLAENLPRIKFEGLQDPHSYYKDASIFCMTSNYEGFPMVLTESMQYGCVPFAFNSFASVTDIIIDGENGVLVKPFNIREYAEKLSQLMTNDELRNRLAQNAVRDVARFDVEKVADKWEKLFSELKA